MPLHPQLWKDKEYQLTDEEIAEGRKRLVKKIQARRIMRRERIRKDWMFYFLRGISMILFTVVILRLGGCI
jgi:hypothetical protein